MRLGFSVLCLVCVLVLQTGCDGDSKSTADSDGGSDNSGDNSGDTGGGGGDPGMGGGDATMSGDPGMGGGDAGMGEMGGPSMGGMDAGMDAGMDDTMGGTGGDPYAAGAGGPGAGGPGGGANPGGGDPYDNGGSDPYAGGAGGPGGAYGPGGSGPGTGFDDGTGGDPYAGGADGTGGYPAEGMDSGFPGSNGPGGQGGRGSGKPTPPPKPQDLPSLAREAFQTGKGDKAVHYLAAHSLMDSGNMRSTRFVPALNRPATSVRWGIGVQVTGNYTEGDLKPIGSKQQIPNARKNRNNRGGGSTGGSGDYGGDIGGTGDVGGLDLGGSYEEGMDAAMGSGFGGGFGGGGGKRATKVPDRLKKTTGELGEKIYTRLVAEIQAGAFGEVLKEAAGQGGGQAQGGGNGANNFGGDNYGSDNFGGDYGSDPNGGADFAGASGPGGPGTSGPGMSNPGGSSGPGGRGGRAAGGGPVGITMLAEGSTGQLVAEAKAKKLDVLLMFNVKVSRNTRTRLVTNDVTTVLINPATGGRLPVPRLSRLSNITVQKARDDEKKKDPVESIVDALFAYVGDNLALQADLPETVNREERIDRVREILADEDRDDLLALAEIAYYRHAELFGDAEVESAFVKILDPERGTALANGSTDDRTAVLKGLLPNVPAGIWTGDGGGFGAPSEAGGGKSGGGFFGRLFGGGGGGDGSSAGGGSAAAKNAQSSNNLKIVGLALHNYHDTFKRLPKNKPNGLGWRVAILPFMEQHELYDKFNQNEPWDSPTNKALLAQMPKEFMTAGVSQEGHTGVTIPLLPNGTGLQGKKFRDISDGTSNTILVLQVSPENAVPWTAPQDAELTAQNLADFVGQGPIKVLAADASIHELPAPLDFQRLFGMLTPAGGERVVIE